MSDHEEMEGAVAAWVLGALDTEEAEATRLHVEGCPSCRQTFARLSRAAAALPLEVEEISPPPRLRERVLVAAAAARTSTVPNAPARKRVAPPARPWKPAAFQLGYRTAFAAAAAVLVALLIGLAAGGRKDPLEDQRDHVHRVREHHSADGDQIVRLVPRVQRHHRSKDRHHCHQRARADGGDRPGKEQAARRSVLDATGGGVTLFRASTTRSTVAIRCRPATAPAPTAISVRVDIAAIKRMWSLISATRLGLPKNQNGATAS